MGSRRGIVRGLRACWSLPTLSSDDRVLGTFGIYAAQPRSPTMQDLELLDWCVQVVSMAIERSQSEEALRRSEAYRIEAERLSPTGSFGFNLLTREFNFSEGVKLWATANEKHGATFQFAIEAMQP